MSPSPMHDLTAHRREKPKEMKPLWTREPLSCDREKKSPAQAPKRRKRVMPTTPALSFDPKRSNIPSGKQDTPLSPPSLPKLSVPASSTGSYDEPQTTPFGDREILTPLHEGYGSRIFSEHPITEHSASSYPDSPYTEVNDMNSAPPDSYDSPASHTSSSSPAPSDQSTCAAEYTVSGIEYPRQAQPSMQVSMCPYENPVYVSQSSVHPVSYGYPMEPCPERPAQNYAVPHYVDSAYGRPGLHGGPAYPGNNGYYQPPRRY